MLSLQNVGHSLKFMNESDGFILCLMFYGIFFGYLNALVSSFMVVHQSLDWR